MHSVLIVDDEPFLRDALKTITKWESYGFTIVAEASSGEEALEQLGNLKINVLITDIKMPQMDGLELIRRMKNKSPVTDAIVLSAYDEFDLVKSAFKLGAEDYLLKSELSAETVGEVLEKLRDRLLQRNDSNLFAAAEAISRLALGGEHRRAGLAMIRHLGIDLREDRLYAIHIATDPANDVYKQLQSAVTEALGSRTGIEALWSSNESGYTALVSVDSRMEQSALYKELGNMFYAAADAVELLSGDKPLGGLSNEGGSFDDIPRLFTEAQAAASYCFFLGHGRFVWLKTFSHDRLIVFQAGDRLEQLQIILGNHDLSSLRRNIDTFCIPLKRYTASSIDTIKSLFNRYYSEIEKAIYLNAYLRSEKAVRSLESFAVTLRRQSVLREYNEALRSTLIAVTDLVDGTNKLVQQAIQYIHLHLGDDVSLKAVAHQLHVSRGYLSRIFSQSMGTSLMRYASRVRIEQAAQLLNQSNYKIYEIAEQVGYSNPEHFSRTFKKVMGKSPKNYIAR